MSDKKQASIQAFLKPVKSSIDLPIHTPSAPELKLINKIVNKNAKSHIWCGDSADVEDIMDFIFGRVEKNNDPLVTQFLRRMSVELGQCVDCLDQYYAYISRIQSSSLMDSQAGDTSLLVDRLQQWNIERLTTGFKLIEECEGDARLNYIEDMLVPNWQIVCLETLKDINYLQASPIQKAFTKTFVNILATHNVTVSHNAPGLYYLFFHHELDLREWAFSTVDNMTIDTGSNIFEKLLPALRNILGFLKKEEDLTLLGVTKANNVLLEGLCIIITKLASELVTVFLCSFPGILQTIISLSLSLPDLKLAILTTLDYVLQIDDVWNDHDPKFISDWLLSLKPSGLNQETRGKMLNIFKRMLETVDIDDKQLVPFQRSVLDYLQRMSNNQANDIIISTILKDYDNNADVAIALCNTWSVLALNMASQKHQGAISLCQKALEYDTLKAMNFIDAVFKHQHPRIQHEWALPLWRAILHTQHELPASINDTIILSVGALVLVDLNDHKLKVEKICTTLREVFVGFEIFLKRLVVNIHLLEGFVSETTLPSVMFYLLSSSHKEIHTHSLELYKKWSHSNTLHDCISYALENHKKEFLESVQGALSEVLKYYLHGYKSSVSKILFTLAGIVIHLNPEENELDQLALTLTWDLIATFMICFQEMKFGDDANALVSRFFKLFEATLDTISKYPDSQIFSDVIQKPIWQQYVEFFSDIPEDFKGLWTKQLQLIASFLRLYDEDSLDSIIAYCQTYLAGYRKYWEELLEKTGNKSLSDILDNLPTASQLNIDLNESQGSTSDLPPVKLEREQEQHVHEIDDYDLFDDIQDEPMQAPNRVVKNALQTMMDNQKMTKDMHTKKNEFDKHHNKPSPFANMFEMKPLRPKKSKHISVSLPFKQPQQQQAPVHHAHHVPANNYQQQQTGQQITVRPRPRFPTRRGGPSLIDKLKKEVAKISVKNAAVDMPRVPPRSYSPPIRSVYSHTSRSIAEPERERRQTVVLDKGKDERIAFREKQRESAKRRALFFPSLQQFHQQILKWDYKKLDQQTNTTSLTTVPDNFEDIDEYKEVFYPLLVEEFKALLERGKREENDANMPCKFKCLRRTLGDYFAEVVMTDLPPNHNYNMFSESDMVLISQEDPTDDNLKSYVLGIIEKMTFLDKSILVKTTKGDLSAWIHEGGSYYLKKMEHISTINREYQSLAAVENLRLRQHILSPTAHNYKLTLDKGFKSQLARMYNTSQLAAIDASVSNEGFVLIQGPPGTGKTKTIEGILSVLLMNKARDDDANTNIDEIKSPHISEKILVVAPSNAAVDELAARLTTKGLILLNERDIDLVKSNKFSLETKSMYKFTFDESIQCYRYFPNTVRVGPAQKNMPEHLQRISIENLINAKITEQARHEEFKELERMSNSIDSNATRPPMSRAVYNQDKKKNRAEEMEEKSKQRKAIEISILSKATIVCTTLSSSGHELFSKLTHGFDTVIIDEAAQAVELSTLIPLRYNCKRCIMVGDPNQLPATVLSKTAASFKYEQSLFQRFVNNGYKPVLLTVQYRMHPAIRKFPGKHFYNDELRDGITEQDRECEFHGNPCFKPTCFFDIKQSVQSQKAGSTSLRNTMEAQFIAKLIEKLVELYPTIDFENQIGVLSPYKQQLEELRTQINKQLAKNNAIDEAVVKSIEINTVDGFQGREKNIIIFSCVRAAGSGNSIGFLSDVRRMNVALTRAKMSLWVVGNSLSLKSNSHWRDFLHYMRQTDSLLEVDNMNSFFKGIEEAKDDELSMDKEIKRRGTKRKLVEETRITFNIDNDDIDLNEENNTNTDTNNNNNNTNESSGDDSYYQWKRKRQKINNDTRQSVNTEPLFDLNSDNANDIPYEPATDTWNMPEDDMARLAVTPPVERKKSPARSDGDHVTGGGERSIRRIDFAALRKEKEREARAAAKLKASGEQQQQPRPASLRGSSGGGPNTSLKGNNDEPAPRQTIVREFKRPSIARSGSSSGMTRVTSPPPSTYHPPASSPKKKKQLQTLTTDNFFDTTPSVFVPKKPTTNPPKEPAPLKTSGPKRPAAPAAPKKNSGNVLDSILNSMSK